MELEKSAGAVVFRKEEGRRLYLLLHYDAGHWSFPKGNIEEGEKLKETVVREAQEETGIEDLDFVKGFKEHIKYTYKREGKNVFKIVTYFLASTKTEEVEISWEHQGFQWLSYEEALQQLTYKNARTVLEKARSFLDVQE